MNRVKFNTILEGVSSSHAILAFQQPYRMGVPGSCQRHAMSLQKPTSDLENIITHTGQKLENTANTSVFGPEGEETMQIPMTFLNPCFEK